MITAKLGRHTGHSSTAKTIKNNITRLCVVKDVPHDRFMWHFSMVRVRIVNRIIFPFANIRRKWLAMVGLIGVKRLAIVLDKVLDEGIGAGGVVGRVGQGQDVFILANGEALNFPEFRVLQLLAQFLGEVGPAGFVVFKGQAQAFDGALALGGVV